MFSSAPDGLIQRCAGLVRVALDSTDPERLIAAAAHELGWPLLLLDDDGVPLVTASQPAGATTWLAAPRAPRQDGVNVPPGWIVFPIENERERLGFLVVHADPALKAGERATLDLVASLLGDQLRRAALASAIRSERRAAFACRLVTDPTIVPATLRSDAKAAGVPLAEFYWPALLAWTTGHPGPRTLGEVDELAQRQVPGSITVPFDNTTVVELFPDRTSGPASQPRVYRWLDDLVRHARQLGHRGVRGIAGEGSVEVTRLPARVGELRRLLQHLPHGSQEALVLPARTCELERLLIEGMDRGAARTFINGCIGRLVGYDAEHGTDLAHVLELALDFSRRDDAANAGFMHRNTFHRRLNHALELVDADFEHPDDRLALHLALRLQRLLHARNPARTDPDFRDW
jgi:hypothetical protein